MRYIAIGILLSSLILASSWTGALADPTPEISRRFENEFSQKIFDKFVNPLPDEDLTKTTLVIRGYLFRRGKLTNLHLDKTDSDTKTNLPKDKLKKLSQAVIKSICDAGPYWFPDAKNSTLNKVGIYYHFEPGAKKLGRIAPTHP